MTGFSRVGEIRARYSRDDTITVADVLYLLAEAESVPRHDHLTRDVKPIGECPGCDTRPRLLAEIERLRHGVNHPYGGIDGCDRCAFGSAP